MVKSIFRGLKLSGNAAIGSMNLTIELFLANLLFIVLVNLLLMLKLMITLCVSCLTTHLSW